MKKWVVLKSDFTWKGFNTSRQAHTYMQNHPKAILCFCVERGNA